MRECDSRGCVRRMACEEQGQCSASGSRPPLPHATRPPPPSHPHSASLLPRRQHVQHSSGSDRSQAQMVAGVEGGPERRWGGE
eukprot:1655902-Rhodomonas_salina.1